MIKKVLLPLILVCLSLNSFAQMQIGDWRLYSVFSGLHVQNIVDTGDKVYYLSDGYLFSYDKENQESFGYNRRNELSDMHITNIYYNYDKKYMLVAYENSNIDLIYENGRVVNIPDLKNTIMSGTKTINSVDFSGDEVYVATDFGYMVLNDEKHLVKESFNYGKKFNSIVAVDEYLFATFDGGLYASSKAESHFDISSFKITNLSTVGGKLYKFNNDYICSSVGSYYAQLKTFSNDDPYRLAFKQSENKTVRHLTKSKTGYIIAFDGYYYNLDENGSKLDKVELPTDVFTNVSGRLITSMESDGSVWGIDNSGLKHFKVEDDASVTFMMQNYIPNEPSVSYPYYVQYKNDRLYVMSGGPNLFNYNQRIDFGLSSLQDGTWKNLAPANPTGFVNSNSNNTLMDSYGLTIDPDDPDKVWFGTWWEGVYCVGNNEQLQKLDNTNSPYILNYICCVPDLCFDSQKNLWTVFDTEVVSNIDNLMVLPAAKRFDKVTSADWVTFSTNNVVIDKQAKMFITSDDKVVVANNAYKTNLIIHDTNGTPLEKSDDRQVILATFVDQDNKSYDISYFYNFYEEPSGKLWLLSNNGVSYVNNVDVLMGSDVCLNRVKVPRNDGTNLADYLLDGMSATCMAIDGAGRKWFGTSSSGEYVLNSDCTEILEHFTASNSYLPSDVVLGITCVENSNSVFIGTPKGLAEYASDAIPAEANYDNVYAYPNPVRPDFTGDIIIRGLMDNSLVKITDTVGNIVYSTKSNGGLVIWDGTNFNGKKVETGVYYVLASQSGDDGSMGCVTKILVVR